MLTVNGGQICLLMALLSPLPHPHPDHHLGFMETAVECSQAFVECGIFSSLKDSSCANLNSSVLGSGIPFCFFWPTFTFDLK